MDISGLSIQATSAPTRRSSSSSSRSSDSHNNNSSNRRGARAKPQQMNSYEGKVSSISSSRSHNKNPNGNASAQRKKGGVDESKYVLSSGHENTIHDTNKFGYRQTQEWEKENVPKACGVSRAKYWSEEVENLFRIQSVGWRDLYEYIAVHGEPEIWLSNGFISKVYVKATGYITYWGEGRECPNNKLHLVKLFKYQRTVEGKECKK